MRCQEWSWSKLALASFEIRARVFLLIPETVPILRLAIEEILPKQLNEKGGRPDDEDIEDCQENVGIDDPQDPGELHPVREQDTADGSWFRPGRLRVPRKAPPFQDFFPFRLRLSMHVSWL